jgi:hypothetical protein
MVTLSRYPSATHDMVVRRGNGTRGAAVIGGHFAAPARQGMFLCQGVDYRKPGDLSFGRS